MADQSYSSADKRISISGGDSPGLQNKKSLLAGLPKNVAQRWMVVGGASALLLAVLATWMSASSQDAPIQKVVGGTLFDTTPKGLSTTQDWKTQTGADILSMKQDMTETKTVQREILARMEAMRQETAQVKAGAGQVQAPVSQRIDFTLPPPPEAPKSLRSPSPPADNYVQPATPAPIVNAPPVELLFDDLPPKRAPARAFIPSGVADEAKLREETILVQDELTANERAGYLPAGSFAAATLISGVEAFTGGTAQSQPQPLVIRLDENAVLPNAAHYQIKGCHVLASVWGDMSSERVFGRLATLTCVDINNKLVLSEEVEGNLIDSDGKNGIRGVLQDRQGAKLARSLLAGFAQGMSSAFGAAQSTVTTSALGATSALSGGSAVAAAGYGGANSAAQSLAQYYLKQAEATMPIIAIDVGRKVSVLFTRSKALKFETTSGYKNKPKTNLKVEREIR